MHQALQMRFIYTRVWDMHLQILQATITLQKRQLMLGRRQLDSSIGIFRNYLLTRSSAEAFKDISKHMRFKELRILFIRQAICFVTVLPYSVNWILSSPIIVRSPV